MADARPPFGMTASGNRLREVKRHMISHIRDLGICLGIQKVFLDVSYVEILASIHSEICELDPVAKGGILEECVSYCIGAASKAC